MNEAGHQQLHTPVLAGKFKEQGRAGQSQRSGRCGMGEWTGFLRVRAALHNDISSRRPFRPGPSEEPAQQPGSAVSRHHSEQRRLRGWMGLMPLGIIDEPVFLTGLAAPQFVHMAAEGIGKGIGGAIFALPDALLEMLQQA